MKEDIVYLQHIREALDDIAAYTAEGRESFFAERIRQDAVLRKLGVIGEATKKLSDSTKNKQPHIQWKLIAGMRDRVIHNYFGVNLEIIWAAVQNDLPKLKTAVQNLLNE